MKNHTHSFSYLIARFSLVLLIPFILMADRETIYVDLSHEVPVETIYVQKATGGYSQKAREVLVFDLHHNGRMQVAENTNALDALANSKDLKSSSWKNNDYLLALKGDDSELQCQLFNLQTGSAKSFEAIPLTGDLPKDRQTIHRLSDSIYKSLYHEEGVASTRILYTRRVKNGQNDYVYELIESDYDGHNRSLITRQNPVIVTPCYLPAPLGKKPSNCLFVSYVQGEPKLYLTPLKNYQPKRLSLLKGNQITPAVSRQQDRIAFISDAKGNPDLYLIDFDASGNPLDPRRIYGFPKAAQASPTFSPDGKKIAFVSNKDGFPRIYSLKIPRSDEKIRNLKPELLTTLSKESTAPTWSPDGKKLAYSARDDNGIRQIFVYDFQLKKEKQLTIGDLHKENPTWAPDSLHLLYNTSSEKDNTLYLMNLNQKEVTKLPLDPGENRFPSWS